jgi:hypothetical protein
VGGVVVAGGAAAGVVGATVVVGAVVDAPPGSSSWAVAVAGTVAITSEPKVTAAATERMRGSTGAPACGRWEPARPGSVTVPDGPVGIREFLGCSPARLERVRAAQPGR